MTCPRMILPRGRPPLGAEEEQERAQSSGLRRESCCCLLLPCCSSLRLGLPATMKTKKTTPWAPRPARGAPLRRRRSGSEKKKERKEQAADSVVDDEVVSAGADASGWALQRRRCHCCLRLLARISSSADSCRRDSSYHARCSLESAFREKEMRDATNDDDGKSSTTLIKEVAFPPLSRYGQSPRWRTGYKDGVRLA